MREELGPIGLDAAVARLATGQHGVVSIAQLRTLGMTDQAIWRRGTAGRLHRVHRGVYAVGHRHLTIKGRWLAVVLACGEGAVLSSRSAAALWGMRPQSSGRIDVSITNRSGRRSPEGVLLHRPRALTRDDITTEDGIPVTTPARTIADLRRVVPEDQLPAAIRRAEILRLDIGPQPGFTPDRARSEVERDFLRLCRKYDLPKPEVNVWLDPYEVDFLWRQQRLIVEIDTWRYHGTATAFESDRKRDTELRLLGFRVERITDRRLVREPQQIATTLRALL